MTDPRTIPTEQLLAQVEDPTRPGIYVLGLDTPEATLHAHARRWYQEYRAVHPDDVGGLEGIERLLYVGAAAVLQDRLEEHVRAESRTSTWLSVYPPERLVVASVSPSISRAFECESQTAYRIDRSTPETTAVVCDGVVVG
jgi:predicted GIY-YIG superfamily endonuclease